jgi:predicted PurR-regulated permease PerM
MARLVSLGVVAALIVGLGITFYQVIAPFLMPLFLGAMTALLCQPMFRYFLKRSKERRRLAAVLTTSSVLGAVGIPLITAIFLGVSQLIVLTYAGLDRADSTNVRSLNLSHEVQENFEAIQKTAFDWFDRYQGQEVTEFDRTSLDISPDDFELLDKNHEQLTDKRRKWFDSQMQSMNQHVAVALKSLAAKTMGFVGHTIENTVSGTISLIASFAGAIIAAIVFALSLYYFLADGPVLLASAEALIPIEHAHQRELAKKFVSTVRAVVFATFLAAIAQGVGTAIALKVVGFHHFFILLIVSTFAALIPMAGTWLVWFPCAAWLAYQGDWWSASFLGIVGIVVIGMLDNVIRTYVLQNDTKLHPLLAFVSVLGGLQVMGLWGVFIGPIVACCLHALIQIFNEELNEFSKISGASLGGSQKIADESGTEKSGDVQDPNPEPAASDSKLETADAAESSRTADETESQPSPGDSDIPEPDPPSSADTKN